MVESKELTRMVDDNGSMTSSKDTVMIRLLDACITVLREQGMKRIYLDAIKGGDEGFQSMGEQTYEYTYVSITNG